MKKVLIFASGSGTNAENIIIHSQKSNLFGVQAVCCNNPNALVLEKAKKQNIPTFVFDKNDVLLGKLTQKINEFCPDLIVLAGFLWKFPEEIVLQYPNRIINVHPALLPQYGGKGMYGMRVHRAVFDNHETETGITIHFVNENYDEGQIIFQEKVSITDCLGPEDIAVKIHELEQQFFPIVIEAILSKMTS
ncbi:phosphoribosylglycinamide formyltransferase [Flavobacterium branchiophilum]|uniref:phosphoribosylglycinamide formyltransferase 1 n=1 Tax=Flavobacterium branchiophilum (strain FL-15) TaxID=1034807 RepID=G2Z6K4_FLABF|nr:phosphoribosylglycinamide formyltransferase [Flavobacterium branchiophilum]CCB68375.1 Phosphoribosylglycinamide formyltransferase [Flavobacterium branchiophilum FL-15]